MYGDRWVLPCMQGYLPTVKYFYPVQSPLFSMKMITHLEINYSNVSLQERKGCFDKTPNVSYL